MLEHAPSGFNLESFKQAGVSLLFSDYAHMWVGSGEYEMPLLSSNILMQNENASQVVGLTLTTKAGGMYKPRHHEFVMSNGDSLIIEDVNLNECTLHSIWLYFQYGNWNHDIHSYPFKAMVTDKPAWFSHVLATVVDDIPEPIGIRYIFDEVRFNKDIKSELAELYKIFNLGNWSPDLQKKFNISVASRTNPSQFPDKTKNELLQENFGRMKIIALSAFNELSKIATL